METPQRKSYKVKIIKTIEFYITVRASNPEEAKYVAWSRQPKEVIAWNCEQHDGTKYIVEEVSNMPNL